MATRISTLLPTTDLGRNMRLAANHTTNRNTNKPLGRQNLTKDVAESGKRRGKKIATKKIDVARIQRRRQIQTVHQTRKVDILRQISRDARGQLRGGGLLIDNIA